MKSHCEKESGGDAESFAEMKRIAITGSSGFYGRSLIRALRAKHPKSTILGLDVSSPTEDPPDEFVECDVSSPEVKEHLENFQPDTIIHLAFVVTVSRNKKRMHEVNVGGARNILHAAEKINPTRLFVSSSATAYGAWKDNPIPITEDHPVKPVKEFSYAHDKTIVERMLVEYSSAHPQTAVSWVRPTVIGGKGIDNYLTGFIQKTPITILPDSYDAPVQVVHLEDVAESSLAILEANAKGPFNVAPPDWVTLSQLAKMKRQWTLKVPFRICLFFSRIIWFLRLPLYPVPSGIWYFIRYPWVVTPKRLTDELGYKFRYSTEETLRMVLENGGYKNIPRQSPDDEKNELSQVK